MFYLNTTRHLRTPLDEAKLDELIAKLTTDIGPGVSSVPGLRSIMWMLSQDRSTMQAYSGWSSWEDLPRAEQNPLHVTNSKTINELIGGLASPQEHSYYQVIARHDFE